MSKTALTIIYCIIIVLLILVLIWGMTGSFWNFAIFSFNQGNMNRRNLTSASEYAADAAKVNELNVDLYSEDVHIERTDGNQILVKQDVPANQKTEPLRCGLDADKLVITSAPTPGGCMGWSSNYSVVTISIPKDCVIKASISTMSGIVDISDLEFRDCGISTSSGTVSLSDVSSQDCSIESMSGEINISDGKCENLHCETASGNITASGQTAQETSLDSMSGMQRYEGSCRVLKCDTASGDIRANVSNVSEINADSMSGNVELTCTQAAELQSIDVDTASGTVRLALPENMSIALDFESASGDLQTGDLNNLRLDGSGDVQVDVSTSSGDLIIRNA